MAARPVRRIGFGMLPMLGLFALLLVSLWFMSDATHNSERFGELYSMLLMVNAAGLLILGVLVITNIIGLIRQQRMKVAGARMTSRLVIMFVILAVVPVSVFYYFSLQFLQRGIDSWFDVSIEQGLDDALELSRTALDVRLRDVLQLTARMAEEISEAVPATIPLTLYDLRVRSGAAELTLIGNDGRIVASSSSDLSQIIPDQPPGEVLLLLQNRQHYVGLDPVGDSGLFARALVPVLSARADGEVYTLQALYEISERFSTLADSVQKSFSHYRELAYLRTPLKFSYSLTLSIVLVLSLLAAIWAAFHSARRLVAPVRDLAEATHAVAEGDYSKRLSVASDDELGFLVRSFNDMTRRLDKSREQANRGKRLIEGQRAYLEAVLANLSSGVISLGSDTVIRAVNRAATQCLGVDIKACLGKELHVIAERHAFLETFVEAISQHHKSGSQAWQEEISLFGEQGRQVLMCRGALLQTGGRNGGGMVVVFDDVTASIQAQRDAAWGEVARRLAHEIKNPLTPIQLSAERLRRRYLADMPPEDAEIMDRATLTIVNQVEAMKKMVNAFSDYARAPQISLEPMDLHKLIREVLDLYRSNDVAVEIVEQLEAGNSLVDGDAGRLRQLLHNLLKNALEASKESGQARICVATRSDSSFGADQIVLTVTDNGPGFASGIRENLFEPYVSTKPKGSGLGLAIVKKIVEEHSGTISAENVASGGAQVVIRLLQSDSVTAGLREQTNGAQSTGESGL
jgi:nitrogen fixation/metabolism regulation signal transduction histidine kinase